MERGNRRRRTRSSGSAVDQTNGGGEVTPKAESLPHMNDLKESTNEEKQPTTAPVTVKKSSGTKFSGSHRELVLGLPCRGQFEIKRSSKKLGGNGGKKNVVMVSSHKRAQRSKEAATAVSSVNGSKKRKEYINKVEVREEDEYTRIKKKLRYFLNRISYEQSLIDAYSLEGWKGSSAEKLRPEKELERAKKEILRRKVKIRELTQHLDTLCAQGNIPESLFNSDGEISYEDIFCSKCGSKELHVDNDIILCDGFCDRGFHQYCVEPPLRKEDIPPDDESWLCPGCACKDYSFDLLNDSLGTKLSVSDSWEKVFPEAAAAMAGGGSQNLDCDLPSDDSEDEEYDPDGLNDNEGDGDGSDDDSDDDESENEDGSSDESASDVMIGSFKDAKDIMNLPSDDSEDDDYDPDAPTLDEEDKMQESSNSDDSDSEDVETSSKGDESDHQDKVTPRGKLGRKKAQLSDVSISETDAGIGDDVPGRRKVERLDYKKLYDEEYENVPTSSSDDEDWDKIAGKEDFESADEGDTVPLEQPSKAEDHTPAQKPTQKTKREYKKATLTAPQETPPRENGCCSVVKNSSASSKQTNPKTQRLFESFHENRYPDVTTRENLAKELQMTVKQVDNWFRNTRFSTSKTMSSKEDVAGSSKQAMETEPIAENKNGASESTSTGSRKRRRR
ncbi:Homeobox protein HAT3.1 [Raphanus sativus]|uniref:Homeobox protein HAT3.1 n=1 Tax=Raphanus sativus TaxID=3726 RepID=A0A6J0NT14_RAPSA|nr:homeobox protein HAT3.1 [Raphanus sativus]XP_018486857.1 homeobox protein HAT3.1 [Raphanus sativus]XP_018486858.1 homeobox protein HAT3.1 [Raphanus sativus]KAJ4894040.1 Homeobox protein HAT3.1 [Raphanus sativus]